MYLPTKRRGPIEIYFDILTTCLKPKRKTYIMRHANIQFNSLPKFIDPLIEAGYIKIFNGNPHKNHVYYQTTNMGRKLRDEIKIVANQLNLGGFDIPAEGVR